MSRRVVVVSGAPGTGKSTVARAVSDRLAFPLLSLDIVKEALGDALGAGDERWSDQVGDAAAEVVFRLAALFPAAVVEGWWRRERRTRAIAEFQGCVEVFCSCDPALAVRRARARLDDGQRHPIHRDVVNPSLLEGLADIVTAVDPLGLGAILVKVDTTTPCDFDSVSNCVRAAFPE